MAARRRKRKQARLCRESIGGYSIDAEEEVMCIIPESITLTQFTSCWKDESAAVPRAVVFSEDDSCSSNVTESVVLEESMLFEERGTFLHITLERREELRY